MLGGNHWLRTVAARAGLTGADSLTIQPGTPAPAAWEQVCRALAIDETTLAQHVARHYRLAVADLAAGTANALRLVPEAVVRKHTVLPLRENDREIHIAGCDPTDFAAEQALGFATGRTPVFEIAGPSALMAAIDRSYAADLVVQPLLGGVQPPAGAEIRIETANTPEIAAAQEGESAGVVRLTNLILRSAVEQRASLIEIGPGSGGGGVVEFEVDAVRRHFMHLPLPAMNHVVSRIKVLGNVGFGARARSQDGSASLNLDGRPYELRISILPARIASKAVLRILDVEWRPRLADLSFTDQTMARLRALIGVDAGLVVFASPPGSGATSALYAALRDLAVRSTGIMTVEDPAEVTLPGVEQITVDRRNGATVDDTLRAVLRRDPEAVAVGHGDEPETLRLAIEAARGKLVLIVMNVDRPFAAVDALVAAGVKPDDVAQALRGVMTQRLVRRLCDACASPASEPWTVEEIRLERTYGMRPVRRAVGCDACGRTGYRGMVPLAEVLLVTPRLAELIGTGASATQLGRAAAEGGMRTLLEDAQTRVAAGITTVQEVERVLGPVRPAPVADDQPLVLVADDDPETRLLASAILQQHSMRTVEATNGQEAIERIGDGRAFALLVLDLNMPVLDGRQVLRRLKESVATAGLPVVVLTGSQNPADEALVMEEGAADYIRKPIDPPRFLARVRAALRRHGGDPTSP